MKGNRGLHFLHDAHVPLLFLDFQKGRHHQKKFSCAGDEVRAGKKSGKVRADGRGGKWEGER